MTFSVWPLRSFCKKPERPMCLGLILVDLFLTKSLISKQPIAKLSQAQLQLCWLAELALISINPATPPPPSPHPGKVYLTALANQISTVEYCKRYVRHLASPQLEESLPLASCQVATSYQLAIHQLNLSRAHLCPGHFLAVAHLISTVKYSKQH